MTPIGVSARVAETETGTATPRGDLTCESPCHDGLWDGWSKSSRRHHLSKYVSSRERGCDACRFILDVIEHVKPKWTELAPSPGTCTDRAVAFRGNQAVLFEGGLEIASYKLHLSVGGDTEILSSTDTDNKFFLKPFQGSGGSNSDAAFHLMGSWLAYCLSNHEGCKILDTDFKPRRLLDVGLTSDHDHDSGAKLNRVFLVEPEPQQLKHYASLSYCWGADLAGVVTTTSSNLSDHLNKGICLQSLPQTIQDAVAVCRGMRMRYLWVDALCIIQGDRDDWSRESAQMVKIYGSSSVTIAVSEPDSCKKGFLGPREYGSPFRPLAIKIAAPAILGGSEDGIFIQSSGLGYTEDYRSPGPTKTFNERGWTFQEEHQSNSRSSLEKRGWCLQEAILPNRILHFNRSSVLWECLQSSLNPSNCTDGPGGSMYTELKVGLGHGSCSRIAFPAFNLYRSWTDIVHQYSLRHLTQETDRLIAISGLATLFSRATHGHSNRSLNAYIFSRAYGRVPEHQNSADDNPGDYYAGLWKNRFIQGLTWNVVRTPSVLEAAGRSRITRQTPYCAPTWSWASINGPIQHLYETMVKLWKYKSAMEEHSRLLEVSLAYANPDNPLGAVTSGYAVLSGPIVPVLLDKKPAPLENNGARSSSCRDFHFPKEQTPYFVQGERAGAFEVTIDVDVDPSSTQGPGRFLDTPYYCLHLFSWVDVGHNSNASGGQMPPEIWFLVLKKRQDAATLEVFERVGVGMVRTREEYTASQFFKDAPVKNIKLL